MLKIRSILASVLILAGLVATAAAQDDVVKVETDLAVFEVTVTDAKGNPVRNLQASDFRVLEDGKPREIDFFQPLKKRDDTRPLSIVFALDVSGSMTEAELDRLRQALRVFIDRLADYNSYFAVVTFGMQVRTLQSFTNRPDKLTRSFARVTGDVDGLSTHAYDAADEAVRLLRRKSPVTIQNRLPRRAVILITDGFPVGDVVSPATVIERANDFETSIYSVILPSFSRLQGNRRPLLTPLEASGLMERTGGKSFYANENELEALFKSLAEEITSSYALAFYPSDENKRDGKFHEVSITTVGGYSIKQNRSGYKIGQ